MAKKFNEDLSIYLRTFQNLANAKSKEKQGIATAKATKQEPIIRGAMRMGFVSRLMDELRDWRLSPFENEAVLVHAIRSRFCLQGYGWERSNSEAAGLVSTALLRIGAQRPSWDQGQRNYVDATDQCRWCTGPIDPVFLTSRRGSRYCSEACARSAINHQNLSSVKDETPAFWDAWAMIQRSRNPSRLCVCCGKSFQPLNAAGKLCGQDCRNEMRRKEPDRQCVNCGKMFRMKGIAKENTGKFCEKKCCDAYGSTKRYERNCFVCGEAFISKNSKGECCGRRCSAFYSSAKKGVMPKKLSILAFDFAFVGAEYRQAA